MQNQFSTVINIDTENNLIKFMSMVGKDKNQIALESKTYRTKQFDAEFFERFTQCLREYGQSNPAYSGKAAFVTLVLPDCLVATDSVNIPNVSKAMSIPFLSRKSDNLVDVAIEKKYKNLNDLTVNKHIIAQNKQYTTYMLTILRAQLRQSLYAACSTSNMFADKITFAGNSAVNAVSTINGKLKNATYLLLDVKEEFSRFSFVCKGVCVGSYDLTFGSSILRKAKPVAENMLFDHSFGELTVLNAKEKAKAKALTMMGGGDDNQDSESGEENDSAFASQDDVKTASRVVTPKIQTKKTPRVLPKFMQRPVPDSAEGVACENFRIFVKWTLDVIHANNQLSAMSPIENVYVNLPTDLNYVLDNANQEESENKVHFASLGLDKENPVIFQNLELFGGFFVNQFNKTNNF